MTTPTDPGRSTPAEPGAVTLVARLLTVQLLAVVGVAAVIAVVFALAGWGTGDNVSAVPGATTSSAGEPAGSDKTPGTAAASSPAGTPTVTTTTPATSPAASTPVATTPSPDRPKVDVLNQSAPGGSASTVADRVRSAGWVVGRVADFHGNVSTTTVYYPPGLRKDARHLAGDLKGSPRVLAGFSTISDTRLTVILVD
jgi:hypothetical protein